MISSKNARTVQDIGREMYRLVDTYYHQLGSLALLSFPEFFHFVAGLDYRKETGRFQFLASPENVLSGNSPVVACANKSILIGCWCKNQNIPFRFVACTRKPNTAYNHVFPQMLLNGKWASVDATYPWHVPFSENKYAHSEVLTR